MRSEITHTEVNLACPLESMSYLIQNQARPTMHHQCLCLSYEQMPVHLTHWSLLMSEDQPKFYDFTVLHTIDVTAKPLQSLGVLAPCLFGIGFTEMSAVYK